MIEERRGATQLVRALGLWDCVLYVAGSMIGSGIFLSAGNVIRKAGVMAVVVTSGEIRPGDVIQIELPPSPHHPLAPV